MDDGEIGYKVLAGWSGGYATGDSWKLNSGITGFRRDADGYCYFEGYTGSVYKCHTSSETVRMSIVGVLSELLAQDAVTQISLEDFEKEFIPPITG